MNARKLYEAYVAQFPMTHGKPVAVQREIYLDHSATTPCDPEVLQAMMPFFTSEFGNAGSVTHDFGRRALEAAEKARHDISEILGCSKNDFIFTSGATESNNIAIKGAMQYLMTFHNKRHIVTVATEHKCVLESCRYMEELGCRVTYLKVGESGLIDIKAFEAALEEDTGLVSVAYVHNEIGVIQPIKEIYSICQQKGILFHTDAAQAVGRVEVSASHADLISFSAHKFYGPKGVGGLYIKRGVRLSKQVHGGGQERGLRSGTLPVALCVGMGVAFVKAEKLRIPENQRITALRDIMLVNIMTELPEVYINGDMIHRIPHNLNLSFACVEGEGLMVYLDGIAVSSGSACTSDSLEPSYVLAEIGVDQDLIHTSLRFTLGRFNTEEEILYATRKIIGAVQYLRQISPLWDMKQEGIDFKTFSWVEVH